MGTRAYRFERAHGEQVCHHGREPRRQARLSDESQLQFSQANDVVALLPVPRWNVEKIGLEGLEIWCHKSSTFVQGLFYVN